MPYRWRVMMVQWLFDWAGPFHIIGALVILPFVQADLKVPTNVVVWLPVSYSISTASCILPAAFLGNTLGRRKMIIIGAAMDMVSQIGIFFSPNILWMVPIRMAGGVGNSLILANLPPTVVTAFPPGRQGRALGFVGFGIGAGILLTSFVAGTITDLLGWRYLFLLTASMYLVLFLCGIFVVKESPTAGKEAVSLRRFDYLGVALIASSLITITLAMQRLGTPSGAAVGAGLLLMALALGTAFVLAELRSPNPIIDPRLFKQSLVSVAAASNVLVWLLRHWHNFLVPFYLVQGLGWSGSYAGMVMMAMNVGQPVISPVAGIIVDRVGTAKPIRVAFLLMIVGGVMMLTLGSQPHVGRVVVGLLLIGMGMGLFNTPNQHDIYSSLPPEKLSLAQGIFALGGHTSTVLGASSAAALLAILMGDNIPTAFQQTLGILLAIFVLLFLATRLQPWRLLGRTAPEPDRISDTRRTH